MTAERRGLYSSLRSDWETPDDLFDALDAEFHFVLDVCADEANRKCETYFAEWDDGLLQDWRGTCWMNPPYGRQIGKWMRKAHESSLGGATVVCLVPARTDSEWWWSYAIPHEIRFVRGRLYFTNGQGQRGRAPFPSAIVVMRPPTPA